MENSTYERIGIEDNYFINENSRKNQQMLNGVLGNQNKFNCILSECESKYNYNFNLNSFNTFYNHLINLGIEISENGDIP